MKICQSVYAGPARLAGHVSHLTPTHATVKVEQNGQHIKLPRELVKLRRRVPTFAVGEPVKIEIHGCQGTLRGEVIAVGPVKARVTEFDPIWNGAVLGTKDAKIRRQE